MRLIVEETPDPVKWDALAVSVGGGYFHGYAEAAYHAAMVQGRPIFVKATDGHGRCMGVVTGALASSQVWPFSRHCGYAMLLALPAMADPSEDACLAFMRLLEETLRTRGAFSLRVYSYDSPSSEGVLSALGYRLSERNEFLVDLAGSVDEVWSRVRSERRTKIRKAEKLGVETRLENSIDALRVVLECQFCSMERRGINQSDVKGPIPPAERQRLESGCLDVFVTYCQGKPTNATAFGVLNNRPYYHVGGTFDEGHKLRWAGTLVVDRDQALQGKKAPVG